MGKNNKPYTIEYVREKFKEKDYELISDSYKNKNEHLEYICNKHKELGVQSVSFASFCRHDCSCKSCIKLNQIGKKHNVPNRIEKHYNEYFEKYNNKVKQAVGSEYTLLKVLSQGRTKLKLLHNICGCEYIVDQNKFFNLNNRCQNKECRAIRTRQYKLKPIEILYKEIYDLVGDEYLVEGDYITTNNNMTFTHNIKECGYKFNMTPHNFIGGGQRCPKCAGVSRLIKLTKPQGQFEQEIKELWNDEYILLGEYINSHTKILFQHKICNHIFDMTPDGMLYNIHPCPFCERPTRGEQRIIDYLDQKMFGEYEYQKYYTDLIGISGGLLSYDFYIPKYNLLIEYQGEYHDGSVPCQTKEEFEVQKEHDRRKCEYAETHNIDLLEIWYWDYDNIEVILNENFNIAENNNIKILPKHRIA